VRQLVLDGEIEESRSREAAVVMAWGQILENATDSADSELVELVERTIGSADYAREQLAAALDAHDTEDDHLAAKRGTFFSAYRSRVDGSGQLYRIHVPPEYDPERSYALVVRPGTYLKSTLPERLAGPDHFVLSCGARGQNGIETLAVIDALEAIEDVCRHYNIDPDRIYLQGSSIGGGGVWLLASRYPDRFAACTVDYGWTWTSAPFADNAINIPIWIYHDDTDIWVPVDESRTVVRALRSRGGLVIYNETSGGGHSQQLKDPSWDPQSWLLRQRRQRYPHTVQYTTPTPMRGKAYWLEILALTDPNALASLRARAVQAEGGTEVFLDLENVEALAIDLPEELFPCGGRVSVIAGGVPMDIPPPLPERIHVSRSPETPLSYVLKRSAPLRQPSYRPYVAGGLHAMYVSGEPLMIVRATGGGDENLIEAIDRYCHRLSTRNLGWWPFPPGPFMQGRIPIKDDDDVTVQDMAHCNLIIVGPASANSLLARLTSRLPAVEEGRYLCIGPERYELQGKGYGLFHYNPGAPERLIMVMSSPAPEFYASFSNGVADRMGDERPLGLVLVQLDPQRSVRHIAWDHAWQVPDGAFHDQRLPGLFAAEDSAALVVFSRAMRDATGTDFALTGTDSAVFQQAWPLPGKWDTEHARWHDLKAAMPQRQVLLVGKTSGVELRALLQSKADGDHFRFRVLGNPELLSRVVSERPDEAMEYTICLDPRMMKYYYINTGKNLMDGRAVRVDLFEAVRRVARRGAP